MLQDMVATFLGTVPLGSEWLQYQYARNNIYYYVGFYFGFWYMYNNICYKFIKI